MYFLPKMIAYRKEFDETKYIYIYIYTLIRYDELLEKYNKIGKNIRIVPKKDLIVNQYTMKNIWRLKQNHIMENSTKQ